MGNDTPPATTATNDTFDKSTISDLIAKHGSSSATAWLEFERYKIWRASPSDKITQSSFLPAQGYMLRDPAFVSWVESQDLRPIWSCVDADLERILGGPRLDWSTVSCIYEDRVDPGHIVELTSAKAQGKEGVHAVKDLKNNIRRAEKENIIIQGMKESEWNEDDKKAVEIGIQEWKKSKSGVQIASTSLQPWLDSEHRRYWVARKDEIVGFLIMTSIQDNSYQIKNAISFPNAPKGTSEELIHTALKDLHEEHQSDNPAEDQRISVTFGISASDSMTPVNNLSGWKVSALSKTYGKVATGAGLLRRGDFRNKFDTEHSPVYVCYPEDGVGLDGVNALLHMLRK